MDSSLCLSQAFQLHSAGRLGEAEQLYRRILVSDPSHPDALHLFGVLCKQMGRSGDGVVLIARALWLFPAVFGGLQNFISAAITHCQQGINGTEWIRLLVLVKHTLPPDHPLLPPFITQAVAESVNHAAQLWSAGEVAKTRDLIGRIRLHAPDHPGAMHIQSLVWSKEGRWTASAGTIIRALTAEPTLPMAAANLKTSFRQGLAMVTAAEKAGDHNAAAAMLAELYGMDRADIAAIRGFTGRHRLTVVIPTWNRASRLAGCLEALAEQAAALPGGEVCILVSDNGSDDQTPMVLADAVSSHPFIRTTRNPINLGFQANLTKLLFLADSPYAWMFGDDDVPAPNALARILEDLQTLDASVVVYGEQKIAKPMTGSFLDLAQANGLHNLVGFISAVVIQPAPTRQTALGAYYDDPIIHAAAILEAFAHKPAAIVGGAICFRHMNGGDSNYTERWGKENIYLSFINNYDSLREVMRNINVASFPIDFFRINGQQFFWNTLANFCINYLIFGDRGMKSISDIWEGYFKRILSGFDMVEESAEKAEEEAVLRRMLACASEYIKRENDLFWCFERMARTNADGASVVRHDLMVRFGIK